MGKLKYPKTKKINQIDDYHGTKVLDEYQWLEKYNYEEVKKWVSEQEKITHDYLDKLPQKKSIKKRLNELWRYDERTIPWEVLKGKRIFYYEKKKIEEKWVYYTQENESGEKVELLNPNNWKEEETLSYCIPSVDGKYLAYGKDTGGNENTKITVMDVKSRKLLDDFVTGWKQRGVSWLHDNSGFYYSRKPLKEEVGPGDEHYYDEVYFHKIGTSASEDKKIFYSENKKEYYHSAYVLEDGKHIIFVRDTFGKNEVYLSEVGSNKIIPVAEGFDANYQVDILGDKIVINTDLDAPNGRLLITDLNKSEKENWKELVEERKDKLCGFSAIGGRLYLEYLHKAHSKIEIYSLEGKFIRELELPEIGTADVFGYFSKPTVSVTFSSFLFPYTTYKYDFRKDKLELFFAPPINVDKSKFMTQQVEYFSKDGTKISMFLIGKKNFEKNAKNPVMLTGYGGFGISMTPGFSATTLIWLEAGGILAIPNLRGGGEYGQKWHENGKLEKKQNVFDDFIGAAKWLIKEKYTNPKKLAISGASNGGLLVGTAMAQRPDLFKVVDCGVPLLDMLRYHKLSIANIWAEEYGSSENAQQFKYLYKYSPYHNIKKGVNYPAALFTTSENDSRVDPMHAMKMVAKLQEINPDGEPFLLLVRKGSGHGGGTTVSQGIEHATQEQAFLMDQLGMKY